MAVMVVLLLLVNLVLLFVTWRVTERNRKTLAQLQERERRANRVMHDAALDRGTVLTVIRDAQADDTARLRGISSRNSSRNSVAV